MGLLSEGHYDGDRMLAGRVCRSLARVWDELIGPDWGYEIVIRSRSVDRACLLSQEHLFTGTSFPVSPGPFKRAAAFAILLRQQFNIDFKPENDEMPPLTEAQVEAWRARLALMSIPIVLAMSSVKGKRLEKQWIPSTPHLRGEILAWLRWLKAPISDSGAIDIARLCRSILVFAMVIEQSYYLVGATTNCEIMGLCGCEVDPDDEVVGPDAWFLPLGS